MKLSRNVHNRKDAMIAKTVKCNLSSPSVSDPISISANDDQGFVIIIKIGQGQTLS